MKTLFLVLTLVFVTCNSCLALEESPPPDESPVLYEELSKTLLKQTGTGISPVIGLSYFLLTGDPSVEKYKPWIWGVLVLLGAVLLKDVGGTFVPGVLKKPLDAVELFQNQGLGVLCAALLVPDFHQKLFAVMERHVPAVEWVGGGGGQFILAAAGSEGVLHVLTLPLSITAFVAVWLLSKHFSFCAAPCLASIRCCPLCINRILLWLSQAKEYNRFSKEKSWNLL